MARRPALPRNAEILPRPVDESDHIRVGNHDALRDAGGTGSKQDVRRIAARIVAVDRRRGVRGGIGRREFAVKSLAADFLAAERSDRERKWKRAVIQDFVKQRRDRAVDEDPFAFRALDDLALARGRAVRVERNKGTIRLENS